MGTETNPLQATQMVGVDPQALELQRKRQLANLLTQQALTQQPQGQMVSGHYVAPSWTQNLANLANLYVGKTMQEQADKEQVALAEQLRTQNAQEAQDIIGALTGNQGQTVYGAGAEGPTKEVVGAVAPNPQLALAKALSAKGTAGQAMLPSIMKQVMPEEFTMKHGEKRFVKLPSGEIKEIASGGEEETPDQKNYKYAVSTGYKGSFNDWKHQLTPYQIAELKDKGISVSGAGVGGMTMPSGAQVGGQTVPAGERKYIPSNLPTYQYDPSLSPAQNRELQGKFAADVQTNIKNAKNSFDTIRSAAEILNTGAPSSGRGENIITGTREFFGGGGETSKADAQLKVLGTKLVMQVPRFEGPQSDKDTALYQSAAGDVANPNMPIATRLASLQTMVDINRKYYPNGDWESIDLRGPVITKQTLLSGSKNVDPIKFREGLNAQDQQAFDWARANPNDPRAVKIKDKLGIK